MQQDSASGTGTSLPALRVDGGAAVNDLMMQFQADVLGVPVLRPQVTETTALGAAYLAGLATGFWSDAAELRTQRQNDVRFEPKLARDEVTQRRNRWKEAVERSRRWNA
jgi:glycerol kinase